MITAIALCIATFLAGLLIGNIKASVLQHRIEHAEKLINTLKSFVATAREHDEKHNKRTLCVAFAEKEIETYEETWKR